MSNTCKKFLFGTDDDDVLNGTNSNQFIFGFDGNDTINGKNGNDVILGGNGNDKIYAGKGNDIALGGNGHDLIDGGDGNDNLFGEDGNDALVGGKGNDDLHGGKGNDYFVGGAGKDTFDGGAGNDKFVIRFGTGQDTIKHLDATDRIDVRDFGFASGQAVINAFKDAGPNTVLTLPGGDKLIIEGIHKADLKADQFIVSDAAKGPSSSTGPYLLGVDPDVSTVAIATTGDPLDVKSDGTTPYRMVGIPDGLGAFDNGNGTFTVLMNHELPAGTGVVRDHGFNGAFVTKLVIDTATLKVLDASDQIQHAFEYNTATHGFTPLDDAFSRFCSADLADPAAFYNPDTGLGYNGRMFMNGEESGVEGRAMAHFVTGSEAGNSYEVAWLGNMAYENVLANAHTGNKTVVAVTDDGQNGQVYFYSGMKQASGSALDKAGLTNGHLFGLRVAEFDNGTGINATNNNETTAANPLGADNSSLATLVDLGDVSGMTGAQIDAASEAAGVSSFLRPEDGAWDTINPNRFYFVTTDAIDQPSRLWAVDFVDAKDFSKGATVKLLLDGTEGQKMMDNITVNKDGKVIICEDVGNNAHVGRVLEYDPVTDTLKTLAQHDPSKFDPNFNGPGLPGADFITQDEEASGVVDVTDILGSAGQYAYLIDTQSHKSVGGELVEGGQLQVIYHDRV